MRVPFVSSPGMLQKQLDRRAFLRGSGALAGVGALGLSGCTKQVKAAAAGTAPGLPFYDAVSPIIPIRAHDDRIFRITVCLRPFRAAGPRLDVEKVADKTVVHNYGHGGSGWSLSWGSAAVVVKKAMEASGGDRQIAVIGAGALGLTAAITAQRAGAKVTIYAKELAPYTRSSRATGSWTPDSRLALQSVASPNFPAEWEAMARASFFMYQSYLGMPGSPVEWTDRYVLHDNPKPGDAPEQDVDTHGFLHLNPRIADLTPRHEELPAGSTPFPTDHVSRFTSLSFNVADYSRQLMNDFMIAGGKLEIREFHSPQEIASVQEKVIINCPGYAARALWNDQTMTPVRGQIQWLIPQEGVHYGLYYKNLGVLARRDGIVLQWGGIGEDEGWGDSNEKPDPEEAHRAVATLQELYKRMEQKMQTKRG